MDGQIKFKFQQMLALLLPALLLQVSGRRGGTSKPTLAPQLSVKSIKIHGLAPVRSPPKVKIFSQPRTRVLPEKDFDYRGNVSPVGDVSNYCDLEFVDNGKPASAVRLSKPLGHTGDPPNIIFFEVTLTSMAQDAFIGIGFAPPLSQNLAVLPGAQHQSFGFHSDGSIYKPAAQPARRGWLGAGAYDMRQAGTGTMHAKAYSEPWAEGDVIGCGLDRQRREVFFYLNGIFRGIAFAVPAGIDLKNALRPAIGFFRGDARVRMHLNHSTSFRNPGITLDPEDKLTQIFGRFDLDKNGFLTHPELETLIKESSRPEAVDLTIAGYLQFCQFCGGNPVNGMGLMQLRHLYEYEYGDVNDDWKVLTTHNAMDYVNPRFVSRRRGEHEVPVRKWSSWDTCSKKCGWKGLQKRSRASAIPGGAAEVQVQDCNRRTCVTDAIWTYWTPCSAECDQPGTQTRVCLLEAEDVQTCQGPTQQLCKGVCGERAIVHIKDEEGGEESAPKKAQNSAPAPNAAADKPSEVARDNAMIEEERKQGQLDAQNRRRRRTRISILSAAGDGRRKPQFGPVPLITSSSGTV